MATCDRRQPRARRLPRVLPGRADARLPAARRRSPHLLDPRARAAGAAAPGLRGLRLCGRGGGAPDRSAWGARCCGAWSTTSPPTPAPRGSRGPRASCRRRSCSTRSRSSPTVSPASRRWSASPRWSTWRGRERSTTSASGGSPVRGAALREPAVAAQPGRHDRRRGRRGDRRVRLVASRRLAGNRGVRPAAGRERGGVVRLFSGDLRHVQPGGAVWRLHADRARAPAGGTRRAAARCAVRRAGVAPVFALAVFGLAWMVRGNRAPSADRPRAGAHRRRRDRRASSATCRLGLVQMWWGGASAPARFLVLECAAPATRSATTSPATPTTRSAPATTSPSCSPPSATSSSASSTCTATTRRRTRRSSRSSATRAPARRTCCTRSSTAATGGWQLLVTPGIYQKDTDFLEYLLFQIIDTLLGGGKQKGARPLEFVGEQLVRRPARASPCATLTPTSSWNCSRRRAWAAGRASSASAAPQAQERDAVAHRQPAPVRLPRRLPAPLRRRLRRGRPRRRDRRCDLRLPTTSTAPSRTTPPA